MNLQELLAGGGGALVVLLTLIQIAPVKINPWSTLVKTLGRLFYSSVLKDIHAVKDELQTELEALSAEIRVLRKRLDEHIDMDDERNADYHRSRILRFNDELIRDLPHSRESFVEILLEIDEYEKYCRSHETYKNNRTVEATENIRRVYRERLEKRDFA